MYVDNPFLLEPLLKSCIIEDRGYDTPCWIRNKRYDKDGYTRIRFNGVEWRAHRLAVFLSLGFLDNNLTVDHLCYQIDCCRPSHLEMVPNKENTQRAKRRRTHCRRGHPRTPENTYKNGKSGVACKPCKLEKNK